MPTLTMTVTDRQGMFTTGLDKRIAKLVRAEKQALALGARVATAETRAAVKYERVVIPRRPGRSSTGGHMRDHLKWTATADGVVFDTAEADASAPHWIIQEIGTGSRAVVRQGGTANPVGRPSKGATHIKTVRSQVGRRLPGGLVFATGGHYSPTGSAQREQIFWASRVTGVPMGAPAIRITKEIAAQHFVRDGGTQGFRQYRSSVLAAARQAFSQASKP